MSPGSRTACVALAAALAVGCGKLKLDHQTAVEPGEVKTVTLDPAAKKQTVRVKVISVGVPVTAALVSEADREAAVDKMGNGGKPDKYFGYKAKFESEEFSAEVPANALLHVLLTANRKATVDVKFSN